MKKLLIYYKDSPETQSYLVRVIYVSADFIGIGKKGQINTQEFKQLALDLEPNHSTIEII